MFFLVSSISTLSAAHLRHLPAFQDAAPPAEKEVELDPMEYGTNDTKSSEAWSVCALFAGFRRQAEGLYVCALEGGRQRAS
jgi:hypothetical protein